MTNTYTEATSYYTVADDESMALYHAMQTLAQKQEDAAKAFAPARDALYELRRTNTLKGRKAARERYEQLWDAWNDARLDAEQAQREWLADFAAKYSVNRK
jgi:hypothetical protein